MEPDGAGLSDILDKFIQLYSTNRWKRNVQDVIESKDGYETIKLLMGAGATPSSESAQIVLTWLDVDAFDLVHEFHEDWIGPATDCNVSNPVCEAVTDYSKRSTMPTLNELDQRQLLLVTSLSLELEWMMVLN